MRSYKIPIIILIMLSATMLFAKPLSFSATCHMVEGDTTSPSMTYEFEAEKIAGLKDSSLAIFTDPEAFYNIRLAQYTREYREMKDLYERFPDAASLAHQYHTETAEILYESKRRMSLCFTQFAYTGGAHPNTHADHWIINKRNGEILEFEDIFKDKALPKLKELTDKALIDQFGENDLDLILFTRDYAVSRDIYVTKKGVVFQYDAYEIAPYYIGPIEILLPYHSLRGLLKRIK